MSMLILQIFGKVNLPPGVIEYNGLEEGGPTNFIGNILKLLILVAGLYALFNFVFAGYAFLSAGGDPKKIADAWAKIWQTALGLVVTASAFIVAGIISRFIYGNFFDIFKISIYGPS